MPVETDASPRGVELVPAWRARHPSIARAVLYTGEPLAAHTLPPEIDALVPKDAPLAPQRAALEA